MMLENEHFWGVKRVPAQEFEKLIELWNEMHSADRTEGDPLRTHRERIRRAVELIESSEFDAFPFNISIDSQAAIFELDRFRREFAELPANELAEVTFRLIEGNELLSPLRSATDLEYWRKYYELRAAFTLRQTSIFQKMNQFISRYVTLPGHSLSYEWCDRTIIERARWELLEELPAKVNWMMELDSIYVPDMRAPDESKLLPLLESWYGTPWKPMEEGLARTLSILSKFGEMATRADGLPGRIKVKLLQLLGAYVCGGARFSSMGKYRTYRDYLTADPKEYYLGLLKEVQHDLLGTATVPRLVSAGLSSESAESLWQLLHELLTD